MTCSFLVRNQVYTRIYCYSLTFTKVAINQHMNIIVSKIVYLIYNYICKSLSLDVAVFCLKYFCVAFLPPKREFFLDLFIQNYTQVELKFGVIRTLKCIYFRVTHSL